MSNLATVETQPETERIGFFEGMSFEEYSADPALNGSKLLYMRRSPMHFRFMSKNPQPETPAMALGTITHRMILEPSSVGQIAVWGREEWMKVRRGAKFEDWERENAGKIIMTSSDYESAMSMSTCALSQHPIARYANAEGPTEVSLFWKHPRTGRRMKARLDKIITETNTIFDLKTTRDCQSYQFGAQAYKLGYHIKMAMYSMGYEVLFGRKPQVRLGAIESKPPHESTVYRVTDDVIAQGWDDMEMLISRLDECERLNKWPAEYEDETDLILPLWSRYSENDELVG